MVGAVEGELAQRSDDPSGGVLDGAPDRLVIVWGRDRGTRELAIADLAKDLSRATLGNFVDSRSVSPYSVPIDQRQRANVAGAHARPGP